MDELNGRPRRLRERRPPWPRRNPDDDRPGPRRWDREREPFEDDAIAELYPGSLVMEDLATSPDESASLRILGRYTVIRLLLLSAAGIIEGTSLRVERRVALEHLAMLPPYDWERRSLERLARLCRETPGPDIADAVFIAAEASAKRGQPMGSFALYRAAYELSCAHAWWSHAARGARGISRLARLEEARYSERLWDKRAAVLERRAELDALRIARDDDDAAGSDAAGPPPGT